MGASPGSSLMPMVTARTVRAGDALPDGFLMHAPIFWGISLSPRGVSSDPFHVVLFMALSSRDSNAPFMTADCQDTGSGSARLVKSYPWDWHNTLPLFPQWPGPLQSLSKFKGVEKETPSLNGRLARSLCKKDV